MRSAISITSSLLAGTLFLLTGCSSAPPASPGEPPAVLYEGARLISGDGVVENSAFVVDNGAFTRVGKKGEIQAPQGAVRVDLTGKTVIPGLIDTHSHLGWYLVQSGFIGKDTYSKDNLIDHLKRDAYYGVVADRNLGTDPGDTPYEVRAIPAPGAAIFRTAGRGMGMPNAGPGQDYWRPVAYGLTTDQSARDAVQELVIKNVDVVKIWVDDRGGTVPKLTPALYRAVIDEAHKNRLPVIAHIFALADAKDLLRAGIDAFAHLVRDKDVDAEFLSLMKQHPNVYVVPNLPENPDAPTDWAFAGETVPAAEIQKEQAMTAKSNLDAVKKARDFFALQARNLAKLNAAGVKIALGTDSSTSIGWTIHAELADMVAAGMTPAQALAAATKNAAEVMKLDDMGVIAPGKTAYFDVLDANPLENITNTKKISKVFLRGKELDRAALRAEWTAAK